MSSSAELEGASVLVNSLSAKPAKADGRLKRFWRIIATAFSFIIFGLGSLDLAFLICPIILLFARGKKKRGQAIQRAISAHFRLFLRMMQGLGIMRLHLQGLEKVTHDKGVLIIANHPTLIDVVVMMAYLPEVDCVVKEGLWRNPFLRWIVSAAGYISNSSDPAVLLEHCCNSLNQGRNLIIFPEGTRTTPGQPPKFQRGVARVALKARCPLRLVHLSCTPATLSKAHKWYDIPERPFNYCLTVGSGLDTTQWQEPAMVAGIGARRLTKYLENCYLEETRNHGTTEAGA